jgi:hypothetical protein
MGVLICIFAFAVNEKAHPSLKILSLNNSLSGFRQIYGFGGTLSRWKMDQRRPWQPALVTLSYEASDG